MERLDLTNLGLDGLSSREWIVSNQLGGFASSTLCGMNTRKYHGLLVAAMSPPVRRMVLLSRVEERVSMDGWPVDLACNAYPGTVHPQGHTFLRAFNNEPFPRWAYQGDGWTVEKSLQLVRGQNTVVVRYSLLGGRKAVDFDIRPLLALRGIHQLSFQRNIKFVVEQTKQKGLHRVAPTASTPEVFFSHDGTFSAEPYWYLSTIYQREQERGYAGLEDVWSPGAIRWTLVPGETVTFVCSTDPVDVAHALEQLDKQSGAVSFASTTLPGHDSDLDALNRAADLFTLRLTGSGDAPVTHGVMAQVPWSAPNLRDALIAAPGVLLARGKFDEARSFVDSLLPLVKNGLLPTQFPEDGTAPVYDGADVSLWFIRFVGELLEQSPNDNHAAKWFEPVAEIVRDLQAGLATKLGVSVTESGMLRSAAAGRATSWMNAKVNDRAVTPRAGLPVELNALWYNAVCVVRDLATRLGHERWATEMSTLAHQIRESFNRTFWNPSVGCCYDVVDGTTHDAAVRPNQLLAISLPHAVLDPSRWRDVVDVASKHLLVPRGLRTLSPHDPAYRGRYVGDIVRRDHAYHQGSVFPWLLGPFVGAFVRVNGQSPETRTAARALLQPVLDYLNDEGTGTIPELFDGDAPHLPGGSVADARAVGEILRCYTQDVLHLPVIQPDLQFDPLPFKTNDIGNLARK